MTAQEARNQSNENRMNPITAVMLYINKACQNGNYYVVLDYILRSDLIEQLEELGYTVTLDTPSPKLTTTISWNEYKEGD